MDSATVGCDKFLGSTTIMIFVQSVLWPLYRHTLLMSSPYTGRYKHQTHASITRICDYLSPIMWVYEEGRPTRCDGSGDYDPLK